MRKTKDSQLRVLHVKASVDRRMGGSVTALVNDATCTALGGDVAAILATNVPNEDLSLVGRADLVSEVTLLPRSWPTRFGFSLPIVRWLRRNLGRFDVVVLHEVFSFPVLAAAAEAQRRGVPYLIRPHGSLDPYDLRKHARLKKALGPVFRPLIDRSAGLWLTADLERQRVRTFGASPKMYVTPLPVPDDGIVGDGERFRKGNGIPADGFVFLFLGRIDKKKGLERTIDAFARARQSEKAWLVIAGSGDDDYFRTIVSHVAQTGMDRVRMIGFVKGQERADAFAGSDVFVLHSDNENFGLAPVEATHHALPSLLSSEVYVAGALADVGAAVVVPVEDVDSLSGAMGRFVSDREMVSRARECCRAAAQLFDPAAIAMSEREVLHAALEEVFSG